MKPYNYDFLVFIGRFQPFHKGHQFVIESALKQSNQLIMLVGSACQPRSTRNPWTFGEREEMIRSSLTKEQNERVIIAPLTDVMYNDELWIRNVQDSVNSIVTQQSSQQDNSRPKIGLVGHAKDNSSYYLSLFPQWSSVAVKNLGNISATDLRDAFLAGDEQTEINLEKIPAGTVGFLDRFKQSGEYADLAIEYQFIIDYKERWASAPYAPTFVTVDGVVIQSGHILLVKRRAFPGKGLWALPGGFINPSETLVDSCIRELREETRIKVPAPVLKGNIQKSRTFDDPHRSTRGRTLTTAFLINLPADKELPKVKGGDDAEKAKWVPLSELDSRDLFEDHYHIIQSLIGA